MSSFQVIAAGPDRVGESPVWDARLQALWWVDIESQLVRRWTQASGQLMAWRLPERTGCIALADDGRVIAAMESRISAARLGEDGSVVLEDLALMSHPAPGMRFNDGRCDASGRLWVGTMLMEQSQNRALGGLYCLDERGLRGPHVAGLYTSNGSGLSPDGKTFYLSDSHPLSQQVWAFDFDIEHSELSARRSFLDMRQMPGRPDGAAVDSQGNYWICGNDAGQVHCISPQGALLRSLDLPFSKPAMCCFGGPELSRLFVTSIVPADPQLDPQGLGGSVVALQPGVTGLPEPRFSRFPSMACSQPLGHSQ
jgi:sugar lactone lactonase YvrE